MLDQKAKDLLDLFAAGKNTPGAGSAAALAGALAGSLIQSVALYTLRRGPAKERAEAILRDAQERSGRLRRAVDEDAEAFDRYWKLKGTSGAEKDEALRRAIDLPLAIAKDCLALAETAIELYDTGFRNAQGESIAAALSALANAQAAAHAARLNLKFAGSAPWVEDSRRQMDVLRNRLNDLRQKLEQQIEF
jgi:formiminotetrahydrofolate cyclodeaminase